MYATRFFRDVVEQSPDAQLILDHHGTILYANTCAHEMFGYEAGALSGISVDLLVPQELRALRAGKGYGAQSGSPDTAARELRPTGLRRDGSQFPAEIRLAPVSSDESMVTVAVVRDATANERVKDMLRTGQLEAEKATAAKSRFLATASHDLRQPLQALHLIHGAIKRKLAGTELEEMLAEEGHALDAMSELLNALLNVARLESGAMQPVITEIALPRVFEDLRRQFFGLAAAKGIHLRVDALDCHVRTDATLLRELLQNLLANAIRYTDVGHVSLRCVASGNRARIEIADTGIGIPQSLQEKIFEDFYQVADHGKEHRGGSGLGLGIVRRIARLLAIPVEINSIEGTGTRFTIHVLTCAVTEESHASAAVSPTPPCSGSGRRVLLIEDEASLRAAVRLYLNLEGHEVLSAGSLNELDALLTQTQAPPELIITDFQLANDELGSDALERIQERFAREIPTLVLTGDTSAVPARIFQRRGIRLLNKPVDAPTLAAAVQEALRSEN